MQRVSVGDILSGGEWTASEIKPKQVKLTDKDGHTRTLFLADGDRLFLYTEKG